MKVIHANANNFADIVLNAQTPVLLDFSATWCGPCARMSPILDEFAAEHPEITVVKVDVDDSPELANAYGVTSIPTLIAIKNGKAVAQAVGLRAKSDLLALFN